MAPTLPQIYRSVIRQFLQNSIHPRSDRSPSIPKHLRLLFEHARSISRTSLEAEKFAKDMENMVVYMKSNRLHKELVERYNPTNTLSGEERARMSAKMVGLDMPAAFDPDVEPTMEGDKGKKEKQKGSLRSIG